MIVELLRDPPLEPTPTGAERRRSRRHCVTLPAMLSPLDDTNAEVLEVQVRNISLHGAGFNSPVPLAAETVHRLHIGAGPLQLNARIRIISARQQRDQTWNIGAEFY
jgi:hypothetical protein